MNNLFNGDKLMNRFFRRVDGVVWDLMSGKVGVRSKDGIATLDLSAPDTPQVVINLFDQFGMELPAFAQSTPVDSVAVGDLIYGASGVLGWVVEKKEKSFRLLKLDGTHTSWSPPKVQMLGLDSGVMVLRSLINMLPGGSAGLGQMQNALLPLLMMSEGGNGLDLGNMLPVLLMSQMNPTGDASTGGNNMGQMLQTMMMMQLLQKGSGTGKGGGTGNIFDRR
jgi:hypothetical protein